MKILITHAESRKSFDVFHALSHAGLKAEAILAASTGRAALALAYGRRVTKLRFDSYAIFEADLEKIESVIQDEIVFLPMEEESVLYFYSYLEQHPQSWFRAALPSLENFEISRDKLKFAKLCQRVEVPVPDIISPSQNLSRASFPLLLKPRISTGGSSGIISIDRIADLDALRPIDAEKYILQAQVENSSAVEGAFFLAKEGKVLSYYGHSRLRTYPPSGGVSIYSKISDQPELRALGERILHELHWSGLAMIEFLWDGRENKYKVIEMNPRLWGSLLLAEFGETEFLKNYIQLSLNKPLVQATPRSDVFIRWLFPFDFLLYLRSGFKLENFWKFNPKKICYINMTYAPWWRSSIYHLIRIFDFGSVKKLISKMGRA